MGNTGHNNLKIPQIDQILSSKPFQLLQLQKLMDDDTSITQILPEQNESYEQYELLLHNPHLSKLKYGIRLLKSLDKPNNLKHKQGNHLNYLVQICLLRSKNDKYQKQQQNQILIFKGQIKNGKKNGYGIQYYKTGQIYYQGEFKNNKSDGWGRTIQYQGEWKSGKRTGYGILKKINILKISHSSSHLDDIIYQGQWKQNIPHGLGALNIPFTQSKQFMEDGFNELSMFYRYIGEWNQGEKFGWGKAYYKNQDEHTQKVDEEVYIGEFQSNAYHGQGILIYDGKKTNGYWQKGQLKRQKINQKK